MYHFNPALCICTHLVYTGRSLLSPWPGPQPFIQSQNQISKLIKEDYSFFFPVWPADIPVIPHQICQTSPSVCELTQNCSVAKKKKPGVVTHTHKHNLCGSYVIAQGLIATLQASRKAEESRLKQHVCVLWCVRGFTTQKTWIFNTFLGQNKGFNCGVIINVGLKS